VYMVSSMHACRAASQHRARKCSPHSSCRIRRCRVAGSVGLCSMVAWRSPYVGVTKPRCRALGWVAQNRRHRFWKCGFESPGKAAVWLARQLGVKRSSLKREGRGPRKAFVMSSHLGVVPRFRGRLGKRVVWEARADQKAVGSFTTEHAAVAAVARVLGVPASKLKRKDTFTVKHARTLFMATYRVFNAYVPGDLECLRRQERECTLAFQKDPWVNARMQHTATCARKHICNRVCASITHERYYDRADRIVVHVSLHHYSFYITHGTHSITHGTHSITHGTHSTFPMLAFRGGMWKI